jgi:hypothetical protein
MLSEKPSAVVTLHFALSRSCNNSARRGSSSACTQGTRSFANHGRPSDRRHNQIQAAAVGPRWRERKSWYEAARHAERPAAEPLGGRRRQHCGLGAALRAVRWLWTSASGVLPRVNQPAPPPAAEISSSDCDWGSPSRHQKNHIFSVVFFLRPGSVT